MKKILVATDGSQTANKALGYALQLAEALPVEVTVLSVAHDVPIAMGHEGVSAVEMARFHDTIKESMEKSAQEALDQAQKIFAAKGITVSTKLGTGDPARVIAEVAEQEGFEQVIIGSRGLGGLKGMFLGSVSNKVVNSVNANVTVIR